jgi:hypothetical protein
MQSYQYHSAGCESAGTWITKHASGEDPLRNCLLGRTDIVDETS